MLKSFLIIFNTFLLLHSTIASAESIQVSRSTVEVDNVSIQTTVTSENCRLSEEKYRGFRPNKDIPSAQISCILDDPSINEELLNILEAHNRFNSAFKQSNPVESLSLGNTVTDVLGNKVSIFLRFETINSPKIKVNFSVESPLLDELDTTLGHVEFWDMLFTMTNTEEFKRITNSILSEDISIESNPIPVM